MAEVWGHAGVVGGSPAGVDVWPDTAALLIGGDYLCSGVLVAPSVVVTAAHCDLGVDEVVLGTNRWSVGGERRGVEEVVSYPDPERGYDVAVVILDAPSSVTPRVLATDCMAEEIVKDAPVVVAGFGATNTWGTEWGNALLQAETHIVEADCNNPDWGCHSAINPGGELVAGGAGVDSCNGDSGGPLYLSVADRDVLVGITSRGRFDNTVPCGEGGIYVRADAVVEWIEEAAGVSLERPDCEGWNHAPRPDPIVLNVSRGGSARRTLDPGDADAGDHHAWSLVEGAPELIVGVSPGGELVVVSPILSWSGVRTLRLEVTDDGALPRTGFLEVEVRVPEPVEVPGGCDHSGGAGLAAVFAAMGLIYLRSFSSVPLARPPAAPDESGPWTERRSGRAGRAMPLMHLRSLSLAARPLGGLAGWCGVALPPSAVPHARPPAGPDESGPWTERRSGRAGRAMPLRLGGLVAAALIAMVGCEVPPGEEVPVEEPVTAQDLWSETPPASPALVGPLVVTSGRIVDDPVFYAADPAGGEGSGVRIELAGLLPSLPPPRGSLIQVRASWTLDPTFGPTLIVTRRADVEVLGEGEVALVPLGDPLRSIGSVVDLGEITVTSATDPLGRADTSAGVGLDGAFGGPAPGFGCEGELRGILVSEGRVAPRDEADWTGPLEGEPPQALTLAELRDDPPPDGTPVVTTALQVTPWSRGNRYAAVNDGSVGLWLDAEGFGWDWSARRDELRITGEWRSDGEGPRLRVWEAPESLGVSDPVLALAPGDGLLIEHVLSGLGEADGAGDRPEGTFLIDDRFVDLSGLVEGTEVIGAVRVGADGVSRLAPFP